MAGREDAIELSDADLVVSAAAGDGAAFAALYDRHQGVIYRFVLHMTMSPAAAEDTVQEVFISLMGGLARYDPARPLVAYLFGIARRITRRRLLRERRLVPLETAGSVGVDAELSEHLDRREHLRRLRGAIVALPPKAREVIVLCDLQQLSYELAAAVLGCPVGTVRSRLHRARALLATSMRDERARMPRRIARWVV
jgi:RNA polymerase sigma factor (sigma-70 family)